MARRTLGMMRRRGAFKHERTSFPEAVKVVLDTLSHGDNFTITSLASSAGLNRRTVDKAIDIIVATQNILEDKKIDVEELNKTKLLKLDDRFGLRSLPEHLQKLLIRTAYYPTPSREEEVLVNLYLKRAVDNTSAVEVNETELIKKLINHGQLIKKDKNRMYLSSDGITIAKGALDTYSELKTAFRSGEIP